MKQMSMLSDLIAPKASEFTPATPAADSPLSDSESAEVRDAGLLSFQGLLAASLVTKESATPPILSGKNSEQESLDPRLKQDQPTPTLHSRPERSDGSGQLVFSRLQRPVVALVLETAGETPVGTDAGNTVSEGEWNSQGEESTPQSRQATLPRLLWNFNGQQADKTTPPFVKQTGQQTSLSSNSLQPQPGADPTSLASTPSDLADITKLSGEAIGAKSDVQTHPIHPHDDASQPRGNGYGAQFENVATPDTGNQQALPQPETLVTLSDLAESTAQKRSIARAARQAIREWQHDPNVNWRADQAALGASRTPAVMRAGSPAPPQEIRAQVLTQMMQTPDGIKGDQKIVIQLEPPELGKVEIQFQQNGNQLTVTFLASSAEAEVALREGADELAEMILARGRQWSEVQVRWEKNESGNREQKQFGHDAHERRGQQGGKERRQQR